MAHMTSKCAINYFIEKAATPTNPPRSNAGYWEDGLPRNEAVKALKSNPLAQWEQDNDYHQRSLSETAICRYKQLASLNLSLRNLDVSLAGVKAINKVIELGMPIRNKLSG